MDNLTEDDNKKGVGGVDIDKQYNVLKYEYSINGKIFQNDLCQKNKPTKKAGSKMALIILLATPVPITLIRN